MKALKALAGAPTWWCTTVWSPTRSSTLAPAKARRIAVAKRKSRHSYSQDEINRMLVAFALRGPDGGAAEGRRSLHVRPRRRGAGGLPWRGRRVPCRARRDRGAGGGRRAGAPADPSRRGPGRDLRHRPRGQGGEPDLDWAALWPAQPDGGDLHGPVHGRPDRGAPDGGGPGRLDAGADRRERPRADERRLVTTLGGLAEAAGGAAGPAAADRRRGHGAGEAGGAGENQAQDRTEEARACRRLPANRLADGEAVFWNDGRMGRAFHRSRAVRGAGRAEARRGQGQVRRSRSWSTLI